MEKKDGALTDAERQPCEVYTRGMGYFRPKSFFNIGKKGEFEERLNFSEKPKGIRNEHKRPL